MCKIIDVFVNYKEDTEAFFTSTYLLMPFSTIRFYDVTAPPFNAQRDGKTSVADAIQHSINTAQSSDHPGGIIWLPSGLYVIDKKIIISNAYQMFQ